MPRKRKSNRKTKKRVSKSMDRMKYEIANEFGVNLGPDANNKSSGSICNELSKRKERKNKKCK
jgi:hypothetical protein